MLGVISVRLAVITPTYNRPELFERLHRSITLGGETDWRHYVVDDGSSEDYRQVVRRCEVLSGRLVFDRMDNSGPLIARNRAIDLALADGCTHLCFFDDDDEMIPDGAAAVMRRVRQFPEADWFMFRSTGNISREMFWPAQPIVVSWFDDVVCSRKFGSDNGVVISSALVGSTRFTRRGRNQREWTFFLDLSKKCDDVLVCPEIIRKIDYLPGGLSSKAINGYSSIEQVSNTLERALRYWLRKPFSRSLFLKLIGQLAASPLRILFSGPRSLKSRFNSSRE